MSKSTNKVIFIGNVGQLDTRYTPDGRPVVNLAVATEDSKKDSQTGQIVKETDWHRVVIFGKAAEIAAEYLTVGRQIYICGKQKTRKWQDKGGEDRFTTEVVVDFNGEFSMLGSNPNADQGRQQQQGAQRQPAANNTVQQRSAPQPEQVPVSAYDDQ